MRNRLLCIVQGFLLAASLSRPEAAPVVTVSAASGAPVVAPESIASAYGTGLAGVTASAGSLPLPTVLGGVTLEVTDSAGATRLAPLYFVSPAQINYLVPAGTAPGQAGVTVHNGAVALSGTAQVSRVAPGLFTANGTGRGVAAAIAVQVVIATRIQSTFPIFQCSSGGACVSVPVRLGVDTPAYLSLFGTGIRNRTDLSHVTCTINGVSVPVLYAGPQSQFPGLDQVNVAVPLSLRGAGETDLVLSVDGQAANTVRVNIQ
jgi:uncharacterized protein (TIGR03437 family)